MAFLAEEEKKADVIFAARKIALMAVPSDNEGDQADDLQPAQTPPHAHQQPTLGPPRVQPQEQQPPQNQLWDGSESQPEEEDDRFSLFDYSYDSSSSLSSGELMGLQWLFEEPSDGEEEDEAHGQDNNELQEHDIDDNGPPLPGADDDDGVAVPGDDEDKVETHGQDNNTIEHDDEVRVQDHPDAPPHLPDDDAGAGDDVHGYGDADSNNEDENYNKKVLASHTFCGQPHQHNHQDGNADCGGSLAWPTTGHLIENCQAPQMAWFRLRCRGTFANLLTRFSRARLCWHLGRTLCQSNVWWRQPDLASWVAVGWTRLIGVVA